jgi:hypothetical protein
MGMHVEEETLISIDLKIMIEEDVDEKNMKTTDVILTSKLSIIK